MSLPDFCKLIESQLIPRESLEKYEVLINRLRSIKNEYLSHYLLLVPGINISKAVKIICDYYPVDFCWSPCLEPNFMALLMLHGFICIASEVRIPPISSGVAKKVRGKKKKKKKKAKEHVVLMPKLHLKRSLLCSWKDLHVSKSVRKRSKHFSLTFNSSFDLVVTGCQKQHGKAWLYPPVVNNSGNNSLETPRLVAGEMYVLFFFNFKLNFFSYEILYLTNFDYIFFSTIHWLCCW
eukprot:GSMAST32.ASY1.ANO1.366.1 assembled CDS